MIRKRTRERGSASLELLGAIPVVIVVVLGLLQVIAGVYTVQATNQAVRDAARAGSLGESVTDAARRSLPDGLQIQGISVSGPDEVRLVVEVPRVVPLVPTIDVTRTAAMP